MSGGARRAVVLVGNPAAPYSRALRLARSLAGEGYDVEIAAVAADGVPDLEHDGAITVRRYRPVGRFARFATSHVIASPAEEAVASRVDPANASTPDEADASPAAEAGTPDAGGRPRRRRWLRVPGRLRPLIRRGRLLRQWVLWPQTVRGWWAALERDLAPADLYHACGSLAIAPALRAAGGARKAGRPAVVVYDAIDNVFEGNNVLGMPGMLRRVHAARERRWARSADARTTVNDALAVRLGARWGVPPPVSIPNYPEPWAGAGEPSDRIRVALGLPATMRIVLFQGRLSPNLGLDEAAEAVLRVDDACLVLLGFGRWLARSQARDMEPRFAGRHFTLPAVHPDELPAWTASADIALVTLPPVSINQRESTPNKFWESLLVGTPIVLGPDLDVMAEIVATARAGVVARSIDPAGIADAIRDVLSRDPAERDGDRRRVAAFAAEHYSWSSASERYVALVHALTDRPAR